MHFPYFFLSAKQVHNLMWTIKKKTVMIYLSILLFRYFFLWKNVNYKYKELHVTTSHLCMKCYLGWSEGSNQSARVHVLTEREPFSFLWVCTLLCELFQRDFCHWEIICTLISSQSGMNTKKLKSSRSVSCSAHAFRFIQCNIHLFQTQQQG